MQMNASDWSRIAQAQRLSIHSQKHRDVNVHRVPSSGKRHRYPHQTTEMQTGVELCLPNSFTDNKRYL
jgi:hypothetical protein